jgi:hypothetical protein
MKSNSYICQILLTFLFSLFIFEKFSNIKFHDTLSIGSPVLCGRTDRYDGANSSIFAILCKRVITTNLNQNKYCNIV